jgi:hypothetical protein
MQTYEILSNITLIHKFFYFFLIRFYKQPVYMIYYSEILIDR